MEVVGGEVEGLGVVVPLPLNGDKQKVDNPLYKLAKSELEQQDHLSMGF